MEDRRSGNPCSNLASGLEFVTPRPTALLEGSFVIDGFLRGSFSYIIGVKVYQPSRGMKTREIRYQPFSRKSVPWGRNVVEAHTSGCWVHEIMRYALCAQL